MRKIDSFIFDLDGTLLDTLDDIKEAVNFALKKYHLQERTKEEVLSYIGHGSRYLIEKAIGESNLNSFDEIFDCYYEYYTNNYNVYTKPYPNVIDSLNYAKNKGIKLFIYTNKPYEMTMSLVGKHFNDLFDLVVAIRKDDKKVKPDPTLFLNESKDFNIDFKNSFYFGDSEVDIQTSKNLNIENMVSVTYGYKGKEFLLNYPLKPKFMIDDAKKIVNIIENQTI